jgi:NAD(P)-dependent dehydrogenase (short-subunit alcohol dehydrogenase family)
MTWSIEGKTVLITGGNSGIGRETAVGLARMGAHVTFTSRDRARGEAALADVRERSGRDDVELMDLDLASFASIRRFASAYLEGHERLDVLVNNAGLILGDRRETEDGFEATFGTNHLGHFLLTDLLLERIVASAPARIVNLSSRAHRFARSGLDFDDLMSEKGYAGLRVYGKSKLANILFTRELARRLEGSGVTANAVHPGGVRTGFARDGDVKGIYGRLVALAQPFLKTPEQGAETTIFVASSPDLERVSGRYFANSREASTTAAAQDDEAARRLWEVSEQLVAKASA